jgi:ribosomal-protein-alanine N-acetyltransferase
MTEKSATEKSATGKTGRGARVIRPVESFDAPLLAALHAICFSLPWDQHWSEKSFAEILAMPGAGGGIAEVDGEPVGFAIARIAADEAELLLLGTHPSWRRAGHGRALLRHMLRALAAAGARQVYLEVAAPNLAARGFYADAGFAAVGTRPRYYRSSQSGKSPSGGGETADAVVLSRALVVDSAPIK